MAEADGIERAVSRAGRYRWGIVALLFMATVINYVDRQMIGVLKPTLSEDLGWTETDFANVIFFFQMAYAIGYIGFGRIVDVIGARMGYAVAFVVWQIAHIAHGGAYSVTQFAMARFGLGIGEAGNFPAGIKAVTEWFPAKERAFAIGVFNAGANVGAIITPLAVPALTVAYGWRMAFVVTGVVSLVWLVAWLAFYRSPREHRTVSSGELAWIEQDPADPVQPLPWRRLIAKRETWAYALGKFCIDPIWWFFLFWLPGYLGDRYDLDLLSFGPPLVAIYLLSDLGSVAGGWLSSRLIARGRTVNYARKVTMLVCAFAVLPVLFAQSIDNLWVAVLVIGIATAAHQAFSANLYTLPSDLFPRAAVGSVVGIGGTVGAVGGMLMAKYAGYVLDGIGSYAPLFFVAGSAYFVALALVHVLSPRLARVEGA
ncbi:hexuronate transporter [Sphingomonas sp. Leaf24]|uniref:MFS transporter n=1 Tax=unclassified Sphingomonas TaxID=196159 RepID=UPI0006F31027|nr:MULTISPECIES: MFS transporter [unclassified Sphingomonas]KQM23039.1 hexuronate transporter [Sphingomonas sp. Leaf5]KQM95897.1 hexuronate transporter [Sphingomonas sp. Leaf24]